MSQSSSTVCLSSEVLARIASTFSSYCFLRGCGPDSSLEQIRLCQNEWQQETERRLKLQTEVEEFEDTLRRQCSTFSLYLQMVGKKGKTEKENVCIREVEWAREINRRKGYHQTVSTYHLRSSIPARVVTETAYQMETDMYNTVKTVSQLNPLEVNAVHLLATRFQ